ncbi:MAG: DUF2306 domain-containing protein [Oceanicaulis sp.]|nr:DUF2306 domain-containing protein [Oceanicaulis sp.]
MQLTAPLRNWAPRLHRMSGRVFLVLAVYLALGGLWMVWGRGTRLNDIGAIASTLNTMLILVFAALTVHFAMKRDIARHRPWAMRLFMVANGVWFMRLFYGAWLMSVGPVGVSRQMNGWFDVCVSFGVMVIPLTGWSSIYAPEKPFRSAEMEQLHSHAYCRWTHRVRGSWRDADHVGAAPLAQERQHSLYDSVIAQHAAMADAVKDVPLRARPGGGDALGGFWRGDLVIGAVQD